MFAEIATVLVLILINGALAMSELAIVSARPARLKALAAGGSHAAATALRLAEDPGRFLSSVQIGITAVGVLSGAVSGATLGVRLADWLDTWGIDADLADALGVGGVVLAITYVSLILGELVPKQIALRDAEAVALRAAPVMAVISRVAAPLVWLLDRSGKVILWLLRQTGTSASRVTDEEVHVLLSEARDEGVIDHDEREMLSGVMRLADRSARGLMTPRREVEMLTLTAPAEETLAAIARIGRDRMPVRGATEDEVLGVLHLPDAFAALARGQMLDLAALVQPVPAVLDSTDALDLITILRRSAARMVLVFDEYGGFQGIVTTGNVLEAITSGLAEDAAAEQDVATRGDGSLLVAGSMPADEFCDRLGLPRDLAGDYTTVAGLVLNQLQRMAQLGDKVAIGDWQLEVIDLDGRRIDKVLAMRSA